MQQIAKRDGLIIVLTPIAAAIEIAVRLNAVSADVCYAVFKYWILLY